MSAFHPQAGSTRQFNAVTAEPTEVGRTDGGSAAAAPTVRTPRKAHLRVSRIEPWSAMKFSFVMSLVCFIVLFVAVAVLYGALAMMGVFDAVSRTITDITATDQGGGVNAAEWFAASRVLGYAALLGAINVVLITALATVWAVIYNLASDLVGGIEVTLSENG